MQKMQSFSLRRSVPIAIGIACLIEMKKLNSKQKVKVCDARIAD
jgi:hypothetical protein